DGRGAIDWGVERVEVTADVLAVSPGIFVRADRRQTVVSSGQVDEAYQVKKKRQKIISRVSESRRNSHADVFLEVVSGEIEFKRVQSRATIAAQHTIKIVPHDVIVKDKSGARRSIGDNNDAAMKDRVVIKRDVDGPPDELREPAVRRTEVD